MRIIVIGGGLSGLGTAYRLSKRGYQVTLLEEEDHLGGLAASYFIDGFSIPKTYHHLMTGDTVTLNLINELGLFQDLYWRRLKTGFFFNKTTYDFSSSFHILRFKPLSFLDRIRFGLMILKARGKKDWMHLDSVNVKDWVSANYGKGVYENLVKHIVLDKFNESPEKISAAWLMSRFGLESKSVSGRFGYLQNGGIQRIIDRLKEEIMKNAGEVKTNCKVAKVEVNQAKVNGVVCGEDEKLLKANAVVSTIPIPALLKIMNDFPAPYRKQLEQIRYKACICLTLGLKEKVSKYYWLNIVGNYPFVGIFEHRHLNVEPTPPGVMYVVKYLDPDHHDWRMPESDIIEHYLYKLDEIFPGVKDKLLWWRAFKNLYSTPVYTVNYGQHMPNLHSPIAGLYITGISRIYPRDRYMGTAIKSGFEAAEAVMHDYPNISK